MTNTEIKNNLINFYAYDSWGSDWGVKDDELKKQTISALDEMGYEKASKLLAELFNEKFLSEEKIAEGYGWEDVKNFLDWYEEYGTYPR